MSDCFTKEKRSWVMARIRGADTSPERTIRHMLHANGFRFRLHRSDLPGKPDIVLPKYRTVIYVHGCFWHGHRCQGGRRPLSNTGYWNVKLERNKRRDLQHARTCRRLGWKRIVVWECQLRHPEQVESRVLNLLHSQN